MKIFLIGSIDVYVNLVESVRKMGIIVDQNFEQAFALAKTGELERLCVWMDAWNYSGNKWNGIRGQEAAEKIHSEAPHIPILIWDGRLYDCPDDLPPALQVYGSIKPIKYDNETYISFDVKLSREDKLLIIKKFFDGILIAEDIPYRICKDYNRTVF